MDAKLLARFGAVAFVAVAITATVIQLTRKEEWLEMRPAPSAQVGAADPLRAELLRCQGIGEAGPRDPACLRAWAESRRRFLMPRTTPLPGSAGSSGEPRGESAPPSGE
ncbi:putative entry exclusion protein TrbK-alt [Enhydrobacter sp.]|jgi:conjugative transfer region protein TrbK|uniref:putative entry exclusion protein TrbK-alt n=1 Tax=Enhydrobacter sp. TaxID=1894999 RepID=UPI00260FB3F2|nr:putative entry exclusion protein TrbK-alt [Enhydrobacter sp.]WIM12471.1 MAG: Conjugative transfer protein TrbK [Enhydrobacter sp.]